MSTASSRFHRLLAVLIFSHNFIDLPGNARAVTFFPYIRPWQYHECWIGRGARCVCYTAAGFARSAIMSEAPARPNLLASQVRRYLSRRYLKRCLALAAVLLLLCRLWPFVAL